MGYTKDLKSFPSGLALPRGLLLNVAVPIVDNPLRGGDFQFLQPGQAEANQEPKPGRFRAEGEILCKLFDAFHFWFTQLKGKTGVELFGRLLECVPDALTSFLIHGHSIF